MNSANSICVLTPDKRLQSVQCILGYGEPTTATIALIGYEEGGRSWGQRPQTNADIQQKWKEDDEILRSQYNHQINGFVPVKYWNIGWNTHEPRTTEKMQCYVSMKLRNKDIPLHRFRNEMFCRGFEVTGNIYPVGKPKKSFVYCDDTINYFGMSRISTEEMSKRFVPNESRWNLFRLLVAGLKQREGLIIFMGGDESYRDQIRARLFPESQRDKDIDCSGTDYAGKRWRLLRILRTKPVCCFVQHPSYGWFNESVADRLVATLKGEHIWIHRAE